MDKKANEILQKVIESKKDNYDFVDVVDLESALSRHLRVAEVDDDVANATNACIQFFNRLDEENNTPIEEREPIKIFINSPGGDVMSMLSIVDSIKNSKTPIWTINIASAYSCGFFIFIAGHKRFAYPNSSFLFHEGSSGVYGDANKFNNWADFYKKILIRMKKLTISQTKITEEVYNEHFKDDWWFFADEAVELGVCDKIIYNLDGK